MQAARRGEPSGAWVLGWTAGFLVASQVGRAFMPVLLTKAPLLLLALSPVPGHLLLVAPLSHPLVYVLLVTTRRFAFALSAFYLGRHFGPRALAWTRGKGRLAERVTSWVAGMFGRRPELAILLMPNFGTPLLSGAVGLPALRFVRVNLLAQLLWAIGYYAAGDALRAELLPIIGWVGKHVGPITLVTASAVVAVQLFRSRAGRRAEQAAPRRRTSRS